MLLVCDGWTRSGILWAYMIFSELDNLPVASLLQVIHRENGNYYIGFANEMHRRYAKPIFGDLVSVPPSDI